MILQGVDLFHVWWCIGSACDQIFVVVVSGFRLCGFCPVTMTVFFLNSFF